MFPGAETYQSSLACYKAHMIQLKPTLNQHSLELVPRPHPLYQVDFLPTPLSLSSYPRAWGRGQPNVVRNNKVAWVYEIRTCCMCSMQSINDMVFNPLAPSNLNMSLIIKTCYLSHEREKRRIYDQRVREIEHESFNRFKYSCRNYVWVRCRLSFFPFYVPPLCC